MSRIRIYIDDQIAIDKQLLIKDEQHHYLRNVMRVKNGQVINVFNERDGEFCAIVKEIAKKHIILECDVMFKVRHIEKGPILAFAPTKGGNTAYAIQKATELGASIIIPILTKNTVIGKINRDKLQIIARESAEQCGRMSIPIIYDLTPINYLANIAKQLNCDAIMVADPYADIKGNIGHKERNVILIVGPEGGFTVEELKNLEDTISTIRIKLGPRILRADTALVSFLSIFQFINGDMNV